MVPSTSGGSLGGYSGVGGPFTEPGASIYQDGGPYTASQKKLLILSNFEGGKDVARQRNDGIGFT